jgi:phage baseplate assembly protein W
VADDTQFLGKGWAFPVSFNNQGRGVAVAQAEDDIRQSLQILLSTSIGERVMQPTFGWKREALMYEPLSTSFGAFLAHEIETAILFFESRIELNRVDFEAASDQTGLILIRLDYTIRATNTRINLVYPFYLDHQESNA